jgi:hypothetical protein
MYLKGVISYRTEPLEFADTKKISSRNLPQTNLAWHFPSFHMFQCPNRLALTRCPPFHLPHRRRKLAPGNHACIQVAKHNKG